MGAQPSMVAEASAGAGALIADGPVPEAAAPDAPAGDAPAESSSDAPAGDAPAESGSGAAIDASGDDGASDANDDAGDDAGGDASAGFLSSTVIIGFDTPDDWYLFRYFTPEPYSPAPGSWVWVPLPDPHLAQSVNVTSGIGPVVTGTSAIYEGGSVRDARSSVRIWTTDVTGQAGILARVMDDTHYYRLGITTTSVNISKHDGDSFQTLGCATSVPFAGCVDNPAIVYDLTYFGEVFTFELIGPVLRAYDSHGVLLLEANDSAFTEGKVGLYCRAMYNANFDNFVIQPLQATAVAR